MMSDASAATGASPVPSVNFCVQCGKRLGASNPKCYYCGAPRRRPRPAEAERRCPFCDLEIRPRAVKCPHCGEFLDGRPRSDEGAGGPRQITFVIDKAIIGGSEPMRLSAGASAPPEVLAALSPEAVRAIAQGDPSLLSDDSGVRALIAGPESEAVAGEAPVARAQSDDDAIEATVVSSRPNAPTPSSNVGARLPQSGHKDAVSSGPPTCPHCSVEVESGDGFCFHCGTGLTPQTRKHARGRKLRDGTYLYLVLTLLFAGGYGYARFGAEAPAMVSIACLGGTVASGLAGLIWGRGQFCRAAMLLLAMGAGYLLYQAFQAS